MPHKRTRCGCQRRRKSWSPLLASAI